MTIYPGTPESSLGTKANLFRRYFRIRVACLVVAALMLAAGVCIFVLKNSTVGLIASVVAFVGLFVAFEVLMRKRRAYTRQLVSRK